MPFTKCPGCRKVQQVVPYLLTKEVGCMSSHCRETFAAHEYLMHSGPWSRVIFLFVIAFAVVSMFRWVWHNSPWIMYSLG